LRCRADITAAFFFQLGTLDSSIVYHCVIHISILNSKTRNRARLKISRLTRDGGLPERIAALQ
jgi:hypothetical protein